MHGRHGHHYMDPVTGFDWYHLLWLLFVVLILLTIIVGTIIIIRKLTSNKEENRATNRSLDILRERFARGEIDEEEYRARKEILEEDFDR